MVGAGWHGREVHAYLRELAGAESSIQLVGFVDEVRPRGPWLDTEVLGHFEDLQSLIAAHSSLDMRYITATGNNALRQTFVRRIEALTASELSPWTLIHPRSHVGPNVEIGPGSCLAPGAVLTAHVCLGRHCIVNANASLSHDCDVGDFVNINPGAVICGNVRIGSNAYIGAGATVIDKLIIGEGAVIGAGAVVVDDVPPHTTVVGVPARAIKTRSPVQVESRE